MNFLSKFIFSRQKDHSEQNEILMQTLVQVLSSLNDVQTDEQVHKYDCALSMLMEERDEAVSKDTLKKVADALSKCTKAPICFTRRLATSDIEIAEPILTNTQTLKDIDFEKIIDHKGEKYQTVIAKRKNISNCVSEKLIEKGSPIVLQTISRNSNVKLSDNALNNLADAATKDHDLAIALSSRPDLNEQTVTKLMQSGDKNIEEYLTRAGYLDKIMNANNKGTIELDKSDTEWLSSFDFEEAQERVTKDVNKQNISEAIIMHAAKMDNFADVVILLTLFSNVPINILKFWMVQKDTSKFTELAAALQLSENAVSILLECGPWYHRLSPDEKTLAVKKFRITPPEEAKQKIKAFGSN